MTYADIEIINYSDLDRVKRFEIDKDEVRRMNVTMLVDTGAYRLTINESIQSVLGLEVIENRSTQLANGNWVTLPIVGPIEIRFADRKAFCSAFVLPGDSEPLLGALALEDLDVIIHPLRQELIINPEPNRALFRIPTLLPTNMIPWRVRNSHIGLKMG